MTTQPQTVSPSPVSSSTPFTFQMLHPDLQRGVARLGFTTPSPIQISSIPGAMAGRDILACAQTGSGKTAAFVLPILHRLLTAMEAEKAQGKLSRPVTRALVLSPTRELAAQICEHLTDLAHFTPLRGAAVFGGVGMGPQENAFRNGVQILVATPGRLLDHFSQPQAYAQLSSLDYLVIDEADRMLDMGFLPDIRRVLAHLPKRPRQTMLFSATLPDPIINLVRDMLHNPVAINIERPPVVAHGIEHSAFPVPEHLKQHLLLELLKRHPVRTAIIFTRTKHRANRLSDFLSRHKVACDCIHGNRSQSQRTKALGDFKSGATKILVATDIAARGIDVEALTHVINFDVPHLVDDYIHRAGRTARANLTGQSFTLVAPSEIHDFRQIEKHISTQIKRQTLDGFDYQSRAAEALEIPLAQRIAQIRAKRSEDRARAAAKARAREANTAQIVTRAGQSANRGTSSQPSSRSSQQHQPRRQGSPSTSSAPRQSGRSLPDVYTVGESSATPPREHRSDRPQTAASHQAEPEFTHPPRRRRPLNRGN